MWEDAAECLKEYRSICAALNLDKATVDEAWQNYAAVKRNLTLEVSAFSFPSPRNDALVSVCL